MTAQRENHSTTVEKKNVGYITTPTMVDSRGSAYNTPCQGNSVVSKKDIGPMPGQTITSNKVKSVKSGISRHTAIYDHENPRDRRSYCD